MVRIGGRALLLLCLFVLLSGELYGGESGIAVVKGEYDQIGNMLRKAQIPFTEISYSDLDRGKTYSRYRAIFFPCGIDLPIETSVSVLSQRKDVHALVMKEDCNIDEKKFSRYVTRFIEDGGSAYFSGYSIKYLQRAYNAFEFFDGFPNMGMPGRIELVYKGDLIRFSGTKKEIVPVSHSGWIALKSVKNSVVLAEGAFETLRGSRTGPIAVVLPRGKGEVLYTSYYGNTDIDLIRYVVYRVAFRDLLTGLSDYVLESRQRIAGAYVDSVFTDEHSREYRLKLVGDDTTLFFSSSGINYQIDIRDSKKNFVSSMVSNRRRFSIDIPSKIRNQCFVKIYPTGRCFYKPYAVIIASGRSIGFIPVNFVFLLIPALPIVAFFLIKRYTMPRRFSGRARHR